MSSDNYTLPHVYYGGDYNPDQWPEEIWREDIRLFGLANVNIVTLPVFGWAKLQPSEDTFSFQELDRILDLVEQNGIQVCMATSTAAQPAWASKKYPDILPVMSDGTKRTHGTRTNFCPNSPSYRRLAKGIAGAMAEHFGRRKSLAIWHISNEYGGRCYCETCQAKFQEWVKRRYGTIETVNEVWNMHFWGHTVYNWDEIVPPSDRNGDNRCFQGIALDYERFMSESYLECFQMEYETVKAITPDMPVTTNLMGTFKPLDYFDWAKHMDIVSWDSYPRANEPMNQIAMRHDLMRGLKDGQPFILMEQTPSQQNWQQYNSLKKPGVMRLWSYQAMARGADAIMFFQLRRSRGACEKYHGALISHAGHENTRVFRECAELGAELKKIGGAITGARHEAQAAIVFDWDNWWAVEMSSGPSVDLKYVPHIQQYYKPFYDRNIPVDITSLDQDWSKYKLIAAPVLYMLKPGTADKIRAFVKNGGTFVTTYFSGWVDQNDLVSLGGYPAEIRDVMGLWVEEADALFPEDKNAIVIGGNSELMGEYSCGMLCDILHTETAEAIGTYKDNFYKGSPALTVNQFGKGKAYYIATKPDDALVDKLIGMACSQQGIEPVAKTNPGVEAVLRTKNGKEYLFLLNHNQAVEAVRLEGGAYRDLLTDLTVTGSVELKPNGVAILER